MIGGASRRADSKSPCSALLQLLELQAGEVSTFRDSFCSAGELKAECEHEQRDGAKQSRLQNFLVRDW